MIFVALLIAAEPCATPTGSFSPVAMPHDGAVDVPTNATPIVETSVLALPPELLIDGAAIPTQTVAFDVVDGFGARGWLRIVPDAPLPAGATVSVAFEQQVVATFTLGDGPDTEPPAAPSVSVVGPYSGGSCVPYVELAVAGGDALSLGKSGAAPTLAGDEVHGLGMGASLVVGGDADVQAEVFVAAVDLAGNVSDAVPVTVVFPSGDTGPPSPPYLGAPVGCAQAAALSDGSVDGALVALVLALWLTRGAGNARSPGRGRRQRTRWREEARHRRPASSTASTANGGVASGA